MTREAFSVTVVLLDAPDVAPDDLEVEVGTILGEALGERFGSISWDVRRVRP